MREMAFSRATEDLVPNGEREDNVEREENVERDDKGDLDVEGARPEEDVAGMGMCEVIVDGGKSLPSRHTSTTCPYAFTMPPQFRIVPTTSSKVASVQDTANALGVHDSLIYGPRTIAAEISSQSSLKERLENASLLSFWFIAYSPHTVGGDSGQP